MFDTLPASQNLGRPWTHATLVALLSHGLLIVAAVVSTDSPLPGTRPIARDTIRLDISEVAQPSRSQAEEFIPELPQVPDIPINAPEFQAPRLSFTPPGLPETIRTPLRPSSGRSPPSLDAMRSVIGATEVDQPPELLEALHPRYPDGLRRAGVSGAGAAAVRGGN